MRRIEIYRVNGNANPINVRDRIYFAEESLLMRLIGVTVPKVKPIRDEVCELVVRNDRPTRIQRINFVLLPMLSFVVRFVRPFSFVVRCSSWQRFDRGD